MMIRKAGSARVVASGAGSAETRRPPVVVAPPADFASDARLALFKGWAQITTRNIDGSLKLCLRGAVAEAEGLMWRAILRQTREQVFPRLSTSSEYYGGTRSYLQTIGAGRETPVLLDEPFVAVAGADAAGNTLGLFELQSDGEQKPVTVHATLPDHGEVWADWEGSGYSRLARYTAGWLDDDDDPLPGDVEQAIFALAAASWDHRPKMADPSRDFLRQRYDRRRRPAAIATGRRSLGDEETLW